jgi:hypothetical protein
MQPKEEGKGIEVTRRQGRRRKKLLNDFKEKTEYFKLQDKAVDRTVWKTLIGRVYGSAVRQYGMNESCPKRENVLKSNNHRQLRIRRFHPKDANSYQYPGVQIIIKRNQLPKNK